MSVVVEAPKKKTLLNFFNKTTTTDVQDRAFKAADRLHNEIVQKQKEADDAKKRDAENRSILFGNVVSETVDAKRTKKYAAKIDATLK